MELVEKSATNGEPVMTNLEYYFPHKGYESVVDQFMLGAKMMVAPVLKEGFWVPEK